MPRSRPIIRRRYRTVRNPLRPVRRLASRLLPVTLLHRMGLLAPFLRDSGFLARREREVLELMLRLFRRGSDPGEGARLVHAASPALGDAAEEWSRRLYDLADELARETERAREGHGRPDGRRHDHLADARLLHLLKAAFRLDRDVPAPPSLLEHGVRRGPIRRDPIARQAIRRHGSPGTLGPLARDARPEEFRLLWLRLAEEEPTTAVDCLERATAYQASALGRDDLDSVISSESEISNLAVRRALAGASRATPPRPSGSRAERPARSDRAREGTGGG